MTSINKPVRRITAATERGEPLCVELGPRTMDIWIKGSRQRFTVAYSSMFWSECKKAADEARLERARRRSELRKRR